MEFVTFVHREEQAGTSTAAFTCPLCRLSSCGLIVVIFADITNSMPSMVYSKVLMLTEMS